MSTSKILTLRSQLMTKLKTVASKVYFEDAPFDAVAPYVTFSFPSSFHNGRLEVIVLDVDAWGVGNSTAAVENLSEDIRNAIDKFAINIAGLGCSIFFDRRLSINDTDENIIRRKYVYQIRIYEQI